MVPTGTRRHEGTWWSSDLEGRFLISKCVCTCVFLYEMTR